MIYAQILNGIVKNIIRLTDASLESVFTVGFDYLVRIDTLSPVPGVGWSYNGSVFAAPVPPSVSTYNYIINSVMPSAVNFSQELQAEFIAWNILHGITQLNKTDVVLGIMSMKVTIDGFVEPLSLMDTLSDVCPSLSTTLKILQYHLDHMSDYSACSPFITTDRFTDMQNQIKSYLGIS